MNLPVNQSRTTAEKISGREQITMQNKRMILADTEAENKSGMTDNNQAIIIFGHKENTCKCNGDCKNCKCKGRCQN